MPYHPPTKDSINNFITNLSQYYTGSNQERLNLIKLIQMVHSKTSLEQSDNISLGLLVFGLEKIAKEYKYTGAKRSRRFLFSTGSTLADILAEEGLGTHDENTLTPAKKLIYLAALLTYVEKNSIELPGYKNKALFISEVKSIIKANLHRSDEDIKVLLKKRPSSAILMKNFSQLPEKYHQKRAGREKFIEFIKILEQECSIHHLDEAQVPLQNQLQDIGNRPIGYTVRFGALVYIMSQIEEEYSVTSPSNSYLYQLCQQTTNIEKSSDIDPLEILTYYSELFSFIPKINPTQRTDCGWQDKGFREGKVFFLDMQKNLSDIMSQLINAIHTTDSHPYLASVRSTIQNTTQFGMSMFSTSIASNLAEFNVCKNLVSGAAGIVGFACFGAEGAVIASQVGTLVEQRLIPTGVQRLLGRVLNQIGSVIGNTTGQVVYLTFSIPMDTTYYLLGFGRNTGKFIKDEELKPYDDKEWIMSLLELPQDLFPEEKKVKIRTIEETETKKIETIEAAASSSMKI